MSTFCSSLFNYTDMKKFNTTIVFLLACFFAFGQNTTSAPSVARLELKSPVQKELQRHIKYLADDKLEGRATGSKGEKLAYQYIINEFQAAGIKPMPSQNNYILPFSFYDGMEVGSNSTLKVGNKSLSILREFYPVAQSATASFSGKLIDVGYGIKAEDLNHNDYKKTRGLKGSAFLIDLSNPDSSNPHSEFAPYNGINYRIEKAIEQGASAILFRNSNKFIEDPDESYKIKANRFDIPIHFLTGAGYQIINSQNAKNVEISVELIEKFKYGNNVVGYIDNDAEQTIVLGAHYDHLGYGGRGSRYTGGRAIHNGADDNASGVSLMIELAEELGKKESNKNNNYLIIGFSGEEIGLYGSKDIVKKIDVSSINYMLNFDMVGRLNEEKVLNINGVGTSSAWPILNDFEIDGIESLTTTESGVGPSDHTSFYLEEVPVLHFFSGAHNDYHKPEDDEHLINYDGLESIYNFAYKLISELDDDGKIDYIKTKDQNNDNAPKFTVTLGVMPDYVFSGKGMRIDSVIEDRPAAKAGLQNGDIVIKMGDYNVYDMMGYMEALSKFKKKDSTKVKVKRGEEEIETEVTF